MNSYLGTKERRQSRVGEDYQARIPDVVKLNRRALYNYLRGDPALPYWRPDDSLSDDDVEEFVSLAKERYKYTEEQALGFLYWHEHDLAKAVEDVSEYSPKFEKWTEDDDVYLMESLRLDRKNLIGISRKMGKSMNTVLLHYYKLKGQKNRKSNTLAKIKQEVQDEDAVELKNTRANFKQDVPAVDSREFKQTLANLKLEDPDEDPIYTQYLQYIKQDK